jgi:hypothetical protein
MEMRLETFLIKKLPHLMLKKPIKKTACRGFLQKKKQVFGQPCGIYS